MAVKIPDKITKDWLSQTSEGFSYPNAHAILDADMMKKITDDLMPEFLAVEDEGVTVLYRICAERPNALADLAAFLTPDALTKEPNKGLCRGTPLELALINGNEDEVPWETLEPKEWLEKLALLKELNGKLTSTRPGETFPKFRKLVADVEKVKKIKDIPPVQL
jgi:hypothetical protein